MVYWSNRFYDYVGVVLTVLSVSTYIQGVGEDRGKIRTTCCRSQADKKKLHTNLCPKMLYRGIIVLKLLLSVLEVVINVENFFFLRGFRLPLVELSDEFFRILLPIQRY